MTTEELAAKRLIIRAAAQLARTTDVDVEMGAIAAITASLSLLISMRTGKECVLTLQEKPAI